MIQILSSVTFGGSCEMCVFAEDLFTSKQLGKFLEMAKMNVPPNFDACCFYSNLHQLFQTHLRYSIGIFGTVFSHRMKLSRRILGCISNHWKLYILWCLQPTIIGLNLVSRVVLKKVTCKFTRVRQTLLHWFFLQDHVECWRAKRKLSCAMRRQLSKFKEMSSLRVQQCQTRCFLIACKAAYLSKA